MHGDIVRAERYRLLYTACKLFHALSFQACNQVDIHQKIEVFTHLVRAVKIFYGVFSAYLLQRFVRERLRIDTYSIDAVFFQKL